ncbi:MAG: hypothetical protein KKF39_07215 [Nanoarchaeota archaeon]|nr:hypothetical protein [Nanoarchaeota archaeon]
MPFIPKKQEMTDGDDTVDIDASGNLSTKITDGTEEAAVDANNNLNVSPRDGTNAADIDSDGNQSVAIRSGTTGASVTACSTPSRNGLSVIRDYPGTQSKFYGTGTVNSVSSPVDVIDQSLSGSYVWHLEQVTMSVYVAPEANPVQIDIYFGTAAAPVATFFLGEEVIDADSKITTKKCDSLIWDCDFSGIYVATNGHLLRVRATQLGASAEDTEVAATAVYRRTAIA